MKNKRLLLSTTGLFIAATPLAALVSCNGDTPTKISIDETSMDKDVSLKALKTKFNNIDKSEMTIIFNKAEAEDQFKRVISLFNNYFGTKLKATVVGGTTTIDTVASSKLGTDDNDILLVSSATANYFENNKNSFVDTSAKDMLDDSNYDQTQEFQFGSGKHAMNSMSEGFGVIYNKTKFNDININVHEGASSPQTIVDNKATLTIPTNLNSQAITYTQNANDGVYQDATNNLDVYTNDMSKQGWVQLVDYIKGKDKKTFYPLDKAGKGDIWPMTNHLMGVSLTEGHKTAMADIKSQTASDVFTPDVLKRVDWAIKLYQEGASQNNATNTVKDSISALASGQVMMVQNGTWNNQSLKADGNKNEFGFLPMPVFTTANNTSVIPKTISQWWGATSLAKGNKLNTAKLFLQFLYKTKSGLTTMQNDLSFATPFKVPAGVQLDEVKNELFKSLANYTSKPSLSKASDTDLYVSINNNVPSFVKWVNNQSRPLTKTGFLSTSDGSKTIQQAWDALKTKKNQ